MTDGAPGAGALIGNPLVRLPADALVLLVGIAGSGKTTLAARHFAPDEVLGSDAFRAAVSGDEADQLATGEAFRRLHAALAGRLARGLLTVVDATNTQVWARGELLRVAHDAGRPTAAIVLDLPLSLCLERVAQRHARPVPPGVVRRQRRELHSGLSSLALEGHVVTAILRDAESVERLRIGRLPRQSSVVEQSATSRT